MRDTKLENHNFRTKVFLPLLRFGVIFAQKPHKSHAKSCFWDTNDRIMPMHSFKHDIEKWNGIQKALHNELLFNSSFAWSVYKQCNADLLNVVAKLLIMATIKSVKMSKC